MDFLLDPNIAYLVLIGGLLLGFMAILTPGSGVFEIGAFFCLALAGYAVYNLSFNGWAVVVLVASLAPFIYALQKPGRELFLGLSIALLLIGSVFLFASDGWKPAVNPLLALITSGLLAALLWIIVQKTVQASGVRPSHQVELVGADGEARTPVFEEGSVFVRGEMWSAKSASPIPAGARIRVVRREGFILVVEKSYHPNPV